MKASSLKSAWKNPLVKTAAIGGLIALFAIVSNWDKIEKYIPSVGMPNIEIGPPRGH